MARTTNPRSIVSEQVIIPARGESKGVPGKNTRLLGHRTLIANAVEKSLHAGVDRVIVTTDCDQIAMSAAAAGASIVVEPADLATDTAPVIGAISHALEQYPCQHLAIVQCTSPMLASEDIRGCLDRLQAGEPVPPFDSRRRQPYDLVVCCVEFDGVVLSAHGEVLNLRPGYLPNRQQRASQWLVSGNCWALRPSYLVEREWMTGRVGIVRAQYPYRLEIDTLEDLELATLIMSQRQAVAYPYD